MDDAQLLQPTFNPQPPALDPAIAAKLEAGVNMGVIEPTDEELAAGAGINIADFPVLVADGNYDPFLPIYEPQYDPNFDTDGCNVFSGCNAIDSDLNALGGDANYGNKVLISARKACTDAGVTAEGSSEGQFETAISQKGFVSWQTWPFLQNMTHDQFFQKPTPDGSAALNRYTLQFRSLLTDLTSLKAALPYGAIKVFLATGSWWNNGEPFMIPANTNKMNHGVMIRYIDAKGIHILDQYPPYLKCLAPDYKIFYAFQPLLSLKSNYMPPKYFTVVFLDGKTLGVSIDTPNGLQIIKATDEAQYRSWNLATSYALPTVNADGSTNWNAQYKLPF